MNILLAAASAAAILVAGAFAFAPRGEIVTEVQIDATPARVWSVLTDADAYGEWNPFLVRMEGALIEGETIVNTMQPSGGNEMTFKPTVLKVAEERELRWLGRLLMPRIFDGEHYFQLEERDGGTWLVHGEKFRGIALWLIDTGRFRTDFEAMNAALKARAEAGAQATSKQYTVADQ